MVRITVLSLLLGALAFIAGLTLFFPPPTATGQEMPSITLSATHSEIVLGTGAVNDGALQLELNKLGLAVVSLTDQPLQARAYPFLHLAIKDAPKNLQVWIAWKTSEKKNGSHTFVFQNKSWASQWLATNEIRGWKGSVNALSLVLVGQPGDSVQIRDFAIFPASPARQLKAIVSDLTGYVPWNRAAMNSNTGVTSVASFYPTALIVAYLILSLLAYGLLLLVLRAKLTFSWRVVALIFLACWISLDMIWQNKLLQQVADTYRTFAGKNPHDKLSAGPDATLYDFVSQVIPLVHPKDARLFISSSDTYLGQRGAYFLYPFNVYWPGPSGEFPADSALHSGDFIVLIAPTTMRFDAATDTLATSATTALGAELVFENPTGTVVRVK